jgi:methyl-accepting chemotaxis protein
MQLDELTQQNAALVEQASAASQAMAEQARELNNSMERYQVNVAASGAAAPNSTVTAAQALSADRRKAGRPWEGNRVAAATAPKTRASTRVANGAEDTEWKEF